MSKAQLRPKQEQQPQGAKAEAPAIGKDPAVALPKTEDGGSKMSEEEASVATDNPGTVHKNDMPDVVDGRIVDPERQNPRDPSNSRVKDLAQAVEKLAIATASYQDFNYIQYLEHTYTAPFMGSNFFEAVVVSCVSDATGKAVKAGIVASLTALGTFAAPIGNIVGFLAGTAVGFIYDLVTDTTDDEVSRGVQQVVGLYTKSVAANKTAREQVADEAKYEARPGGDWEREERGDPAAFQQRVAQAESAADAMDAKTTTADQVAPLVDIWKRQNVDEVHGGMNGESGHARADAGGASNQAWKDWGGPIRNERDLFTHQVDGELGRAGLHLGETEKWRAEVANCDWSAEQIVDVNRGVWHEPSVADVDLFKRWLWHEAKRQYGSEYGWVRTKQRDAIMAGDFTANVSFDLEVSQGCVEAERFHWQLDFPTVDVPGVSCDDVVRFSTAPHEKH